MRKAVVLKAHLGVKKVLACSDQSGRWCATRADSDVRGVRSCRVCALGRDSLLSAAIGGGATSRVLRRDGFWVALPECVDRVVDLLPREGTLAFKDLYQRGDPPHVGEGEFLNDGEFFGVEFFSHPCLCPRPHAPLRDQSSRLLCSPP